MRTLQKRVKFSNGQINPRLLERADLPILDSSAQSIINFISTPYGSVRSREGTLAIDSVGSLLVQKDIDTITSDIGGTVSDLEDDNIFTSNGLSGATDMITVDMGAKDTYSNFKVQTISLDYSPASITISIDSVGAIDSISVDSGGVGLKNASISIEDDTGSGAVLTPVTDSKGTLTSVTVTNAGSGYTDPTGTVNSDLPTMTVDVEISDDDITYTSVDSFDINTTEKTFGIPVESDYRYIKMSASSGVKSRLLLDKIIISNDESTSQNNQYLAKIVPFEFNENQKYLLVLKDETIDVYQDDSFLETINAPGLKEDYFETLKYTQDADTMVLTHPEMRTKQIQRTGIGALNDFIPTFSAGETTKDSFFISADGEGEYKAVDADTSTYYSQGDYVALGAANTNLYNDKLTDEFILDFDGARSLTRVVLNVGQTKSFTLYGKKVDGSYEEIFADSANTRKNRAVTIDVNTTYYGLKIENTGYKTSGFAGFRTKTNWYSPRIYNIDCYSTTTNIFTFSNFDFVNIPYFAFDGETKTTQNITLNPSGAEGGLEITASANVFSSSSVGQKIDGNGGIFKITEYINEKKVFGYTIIPFYTSNSFSTWTLISGYELVWSEARGYPSSCLFYQQRLWFGGSKERPNTLWASRINSYTDFQNSGNYDNDSIEATLSSSKIDSIINIYGNRGVQIFTRGSEYVASEESLTPNNITIIKNTSNGSVDKVQPVDINGTTLFVEKNGQSLLSFVYNEGQSAFVTSNLSLLTDLIDNPVSMAFDYNSTRTKGNYLYVVNDDGDIVVSCIMLDQKINSYVQMTTNEGSFTDVAVMGGDVYFLVQRGTDLYLEKLFDIRTDGTISKQPAQIITGLEKFNGEDVYAYTEDKNYGEFTVSGGQIDLGETPDDIVYVGYSFNYAIESNGLEINRQSQNIDKRVSKIVAVTQDTEKMTIEGSQKTVSNDRFTFYSVTRYKRDCTFSITGEFDFIEILSLVLYINYGAK